MKTRYVFSAVIGAVILSGAALAQSGAPVCAGPQCGPRARGGPPSMRAQRGPQGMMGGKQMHHGPQGMMAEKQMHRGPQGRQGGPQMQRGGPGSGMMGGRKPQLNPQRLKEAGVKEEQLEALKSFRDEQQIKQIDLKAEVDKAQLALKQVMGNENADEKAALAALERVSKARTDIARQGISAKFKMREILGEEVIKKLREMGPPKGKGPGGPRGPGSQKRGPGGAPLDKKS